jgi:hypothetical protein
VVFEPGAMMYSAVGNPTPCRHGQFAGSHAPDDADVDDRCLCMATAVLASKPQPHSYTTAIQQAHSRQARQQSGVSTGTQLAAVQLAAHSTYLCVLFPFGDNVEGWTGGAASS